MLEKILISIISVTVLVQLYCNFNYKNSVIPNEKDIEEDDEEETNDEKVDNKQTDNILKNNNLKNEPVLNNNSANDNYMNTNQNLNIFDDYDYGKPHFTDSTQTGPIYIWKFSKPNPWSTIKYKPGSDYAYNYSMIVKIPTFDMFNDWKKLIPNLSFNPESNEIIIPSNDEEGALSVANLMLNYFKNKIELDEIINNNLLNISINKAKKYPNVKYKLKKQVVDMMNSKNVETFKRESEYQEDLYKAKKQQVESFDEPLGYGGLEFSYL